MKTKNNHTRKNNRNTSKKAIAFTTALAVGLPAIVAGVPAVQAEDSLNFEYIKTFGGKSVDNFRSIAATSDGGYITVGSSSSSFGGWTNKAGDDMVIVKFNSDGEQQWVKGFGGSGQDLGVSVTGTKDGGILVAGYSYSTNAGFVTKGDADMVVLKYDLEGNKVFQSTFGGSKVDASKVIIESNDGGFLVLGESESTDAGFTKKTGARNDIIAVKFSKDGEQQWVKAYGGNDFDDVRGGRQTKDGGYIIVGHTNSTDMRITKNGDMTAVAIKIDSSGNQQWAKGFDGSKGANFNGVYEEEDGRLIAYGSSFSTDAGFTNAGGSDIILVEYAPDGTQLSVRSIGGNGNDIVNGIERTSDNGYLLTGYSRSTDNGFTNNGLWDGFILKYNSKWEYQWTESFGGERGEEIHGITKLNNSDIVLMGVTESTSGDYVTTGSNDGLHIKLKESAPPVSLEDATKAVELAESQKTIETITLEVFEDALIKVNLLPDSTDKSALLERMNKLIQNRVTEAITTYVENETLTSEYVDLLNGMVTLLPEGEFKEQLKTQLGGVYETVVVRAETLKEEQYKGYAITLITSLPDSMERTSWLDRLNAISINTPPTNTKPIIDQEVEAGKTIVLNASDYFEDLDGDNLTYELTTSDDHDSDVWVTTTGEIKFRSAHEGVYTVTATASDGKSTTPPVTFKVTVTPSTSNGEGIKPPEGSLDPVDVYKAVINVPLIGVGTTKTLFVEGLLSEVDLEDATISLKSTDNSIADTVYNAENKTISFTNLKQGFTNVQLIAEDTSGNKGVLLYMVDTFDQPKWGPDFIANGEIQLGKEAYVVALDDVYKLFTNGDPVTYSVSVETTDTTTPDTAEVETASLTPRTNEFVFEVPEGVTTTTLHDDTDLLIRLVNGKLVVEGKQAGAYDVSVTASTASNPLPSKVNFTLNVLPSDPTGGGNPDIPWTPIEPGTPPTNPDIPWTPIEPGTPVTPPVDPPTNPDIPWTPIEPGNPTNPDIPWTPIEPGNPVDPTPPVTPPVDPTPPVTPPTEGGGGDGGTKPPTEGGGNGGNNGGGSSNGGGSNGGGSNGGGGTSDTKPTPKPDPKPDTKPEVKPPIVIPPTLEDQLEDIIVDIDKDENGDISIDLGGETDFIGDNGGTVTVENGKVTIEVDGVEKEYAIDLGDYDFTGKRAIHTENGSEWTAMHYLGDEKLVITTSNLENLVITSRVNHPFTDLNGKWNHLDEIDDLYNYIITKGTTATTFSPSDSITRAQFAAMVARSLEVEPNNPHDKYTLSDLNGKWYAKDVQSLIDLGIIKGYEDGTFGGSDTLTRQQASAIIVRLLDVMGMDTQPTETPVFKDDKSIAQYAKQGVYFLAEQGILVNGEDTNFNPKDNLTRDHMAKILIRALRLTDFY